MDGESLNHEYHSNNGSPNQITETQNLLSLSNHIHQKEAKATVSDPECHCNEAGSIAGSKSGAASKNGGGGGVRTRWGTKFGDITIFLFR